MRLMPSAVSISHVKNRPRDILSLVEKGQVMLTARGTGVAVIASLDEWNSMVEQLKRYERRERLRAAIRRNDVVDFAVN